MEEEYEYNGDVTEMKEDGRRKADSEEEEEVEREEEYEEEEEVFKRPIREVFDVFEAFPI